ncbi:MAG: hypothetical protein B6I26_01695, partial [Desulfobacteraceae bacterium 4572_130]
IILISLTCVSLTMAENNSPENVLKKNITEILTLLNISISNNENKIINKEQKNNELFKKLQKMFDFRTLSMGVLGKNWKKFSDKEKITFIELFSHCVADYYFAKIKTQGIKEISIKYIKTKILPPTKSGIERAEIYTEVNYNNIATPIDYKMLKKQKGFWRIYDVKIEGVSLVSNYRDQYNKKFMDIPEKIIKELKNKLGK